MRSSLANLLAALPLLACSPHRALPISDGSTPVDAAAAPSDLAQAAGPCDVPVDGGTAPRVLACHSGCTTSMFAQADLVEEFDDGQV